MRDKSWQYLQELRQRLLRCALSFFAVFALCVWQLPALYQLCLQPLGKSLPHTTIIATKITTLVTFPIHLCLLCSILISTPLFIQQLWQFLAPALYAKERRLLCYHIVSSILLFYAGVSLAFYWICPCLLRCITSMAPIELQLLPEITSYLEFVMYVLVITGLALQVPLITRILVKTQVIAKNSIKSLRPYVIVIAFVLGMVLTPPDVVFQIMLALPLWALFEVGLFLS
jgi:sec-independent protein translocase protein TatC